MSAVEAYEPDDYELEDVPALSTEGMAVAAKAMRRLNAIERKRAEVNKVYDAERADVLADLDHWRDDRLRQLERDAEYYRTFLEGFLAQRREAYDTKSIELPNGRIESRQGQPKYEVDLATAMAHLKATHKEWIKTEVVEKLDVTALKKQTTVVDGKAIDINGEAIPGVSVTDADITYSIKTNGERL